MEIRNNVDTGSPVRLKEKKNDMEYMNIVESA